MTESHKTRFAPSPTGHIHIGNARTALFNALAARAGGAPFLLRIEDTDQERSSDRYRDDLVEDLKWLGIEWQEGFAAAGVNGPYLQSQRQEIHNHNLQQLLAKGKLYHCFCTPAQLSLSRKLQRAAGQPPRYAGTCSHIPDQEARTRLAAGEPATLRFRVERGTTIEFDDLVRGRQRFNSDDIGDFIVRRADGVTAFFFANALDDALMGVELVLRGEDHLTNTPRQLLLLDALGLAAPRYGHISLVVGSDGAPLSKRHGSRSLRQLRDEGWLPQAIVNYMARLGHSGHEERLLDLDQLAAGFAAERLGHAPAHYDETQLLHWQREAVLALDPEALWHWLEPVVGDRVPSESRIGFSRLVQPNLLLPAEALRWADVLFSEPLVPGSDAIAEMVATGSELFEQAAAAVRSGIDSFQLLGKHLGQESGRKGKRLFMPLRAALTGELHGPQLGELVGMLPTRVIIDRFETAARQDWPTGER
jgi:nondiscriminating glutamyl-tRNA synthetase